MFELVFHNGKSLQYRSCDFYDDKHEFDYLVYLKKLCRFVC